MSWKEKEYAAPPKKNPKLMTHKEALEWELECDKVSMTNATGKYRKAYEQRIKEIEMELNPPKRSKKKSSKPKQPKRVPLSPKQVKALLFELDLQHEHLAKIKDKDLRVGPSLRIKEIERDLKLHDPKFKIPEYDANGQREEPVAKKPKEE